MPALTGTATPWAEWNDDAATAETVYVRDGDRAGDIDLLVEALRADGVAESLREAYSLANTIRYVHGHYGYVLGEPAPVECDAAGETKDGDTVEATCPCVFALLESTACRHPWQVGPS